MPVRDGHIGKGRKCGERAAESGGREPTPAIVVVVGGPGQDSYGID
jgi:hypothetical protein